MPSFAKPRIGEHEIELPRWEGTAKSLRASSALRRSSALLAHKKNRITIIREPRHRTASGFEIAWGSTEPVSTVMIRARVTAAVEGASPVPLPALKAHARPGRVCTQGAPPDSESLNMYAYVRNDPINASDPLGLTGPAENHVLTRKREFGEMRRQ